MLRSSRWIQRSILPFLIVSNCNVAPQLAVSAFQKSALRFHCVPSRQNRRCGQGLGKCRSFGTSRKESLVRNLFFRTTDASSKPRRRTIDPDVFGELKSASLSLPYQIAFQGSTTDDSDSLLIRTPQPPDLDRLVPMCLDEFSTGSPLGILDFPIQDLSKVSNWWDRLTFQPYVSLSLRSKMMSNLSGGCNDPVMLVLSRLQANEEEIVGMLELSLQPPNPNVNPPAFPVPRWAKEMYCKLTGYTLQGWVTNVLVDPQYRGLGYSKLLMAASEGIAKSWGCESIYLHSDADIRSGKIAQSLYEGLGYEVVNDSTPEFSWMTNGGYNPMSSIRMIEGVPLLCFRKTL